MNQKTKFTAGKARLSKGNHRMRVIVERGSRETFDYYCRFVTPDWHESKSGAKRGTSPNYYGFLSQDETDAQLIVAAFNSATAAQDMGYDGIRAVEALPVLIKAVEHALNIGLAWRIDANPDGNLSRGESADFDAACQFATEMDSALTKAKGLIKSQQNALAVGEQKPRW